VLFELLGFFIIAQNSDFLFTTIKLCNSNDINLLDKDAFIVAVDKINAVMFWSCPKFATIKLLT